ncbi:MAG: type II toxin-antitoxin system RelE/ParE family toxin [Bradyrhizobium sp.]
MANRPLKSPQAEVDLFAIWDFIAADSARAADALINRIEAAFDMLAETPFAGRARGDLVRDLRSFPVGNYIIFYLPRPDGIEVLRVVHGRQDIDADDMER